MNIKRAFALRQNKPNSKPIKPNFKLFTKAVIRKKLCFLIAQIENFSHTTYPFIDCYFSKERLLYQP